MKRGGPLKRKKQMKRGGPLRSKRKRVNSPYGTKAKPLRGKEIDIANSQAFRQAARDQRCCQVPSCESTGAFDAHHVVEKQYLKANHLPQFNTENALRICKDCHRRHTNKPKSGRIPIRALTIRNVRYAFYLLGGYAYDYLRQHYDCGPQPEWTEAELELAA